MAISVSSNPSTVGIGVAENPTISTDADGNEVVTYGKAGTVKPDGTTIVVDDDGTIHCVAKVQIATKDRAGVVYPDGITITIDRNGVLHGATIWDKAKNGVLGIVKPDGESVTVDSDGVIRAVSAGIATIEKAGLVKLDGKTVVADSTDKSKISVQVDPSLFKAFLGATNSEDGTTGFVPKPGIGQEEYRLKGDGTWDLPNPEYPSGYYDEIKKLVDDESTIRANVDKNYEDQINMMVSGSNINLGAVPSNMQAFHAKGVQSKVKLYMKGSKVQKVQTNTDKVVVTSYPGGFKVVRKQRGYPEDENDGTLIIDVAQGDYDAYAITPYIDENVVVGETYYYAAFPYSITGAVNNYGDDVNRCKVTVTDLDDYELYGFDIIQEIADPDKRVIYPNDVDNNGYDPFIMDFSNNTWDAHSWMNTFFMKGIRPVMLNPDGSVAYELDHNDQTKQIDGVTDSQITNNSHNMNAMVEFPKMYFCRWTDPPTTNEDGETVTISHVRVSDKDLSDDTHKYYCYAHMTDTR